MKTTRRKTKIVGKQDYINPQTGQLVTMQVIEVEERDANFRKLWIGHLLDAVEEVGNRKMQLMMWLLDNADAYNRVIGTTRTLAEETKISQKTVVETLQALEKKDIIRRQTGVITLNPDVIFKGGTSTRMDILIRYRNMNAKDAEKSNQTENHGTEHIEASSIASAQEVLPL
jgi:DNA-binding transcriptional regulator YhcF (GntR family)